MPSLVFAAPTSTELLVAASTIWVVVTAVLVMFMQAGFAFLEAGLTRMKNAGHIAGKNVLIFAVCSVVYWAVGFGIAFGDSGNLFVGGSGFFPSVTDLTTVPALAGDAYHGAFSWFAEIPGAAGYLFEVVFAGVSLAIVWGAMAERAKLWVYFAFGVVFTLIYSVTSHWIWSPQGWLFKGTLADKIGLGALGMQDFAGSTVVHFQGALAALAGAIILGPRIGKFGHDGRANPIPGHNIPYAVLGTFILWFGWFGFNPGSTLSVDFGGFGYFAYVATTTNIAAASGALGGIITAWVVLKKPDLSMMLNGVIAALVAITAASGFVAPWAAVVIGLVSGFIAVVGVIWIEKIGIDDPIGAVSVHGMAGIWGTLACGLFAVPLLAKNLATGQGGLVYGSHSFNQLGVQALGLVCVGAFTFSASFGSLWVMNKLWGIRAHEEAETMGLDVSEHGMWGYPEFYIPVPGGYGTESHSHLGSAAPVHVAGSPPSLEHPPPTVLE